MANTHAILDLEGLYKTKQEMKLHQKIISFNNLKQIANVGLKLCCYLLLVPIVVFLLEDKVIKLSCKYYWGEKYIYGYSSFKLFFWTLYLAASLTALYYLFCLVYLLYSVIKISGTSNFRLTLLFWLPLLILFIFLPILFFYLTSQYDYRITVCFAMLHLTYYILFFMVQFILAKAEQLINSKIMACKKAAVEN